MHPVLESIGVHKLSDDSRHIDMYDVYHWIVDALQYSGALSPSERSMLGNFIFDWENEVGHGN